ncbi:hypothetical protein OG698_01895 [Streptomyces sp. NBC_01003]|uniref:hypothetical protein n=1 Tax=Streptomyces sp. NBC_01003 TaxID=2903714 RepID=UPI00386CDE7A|nr:hypothetical protein OG698_01895 [Streptomyces sp. NBC_01003]
MPIHRFASAFDAFGPLGSEPGRAALNPDQRLLYNPAEAYFGPLRQYPLSNSRDVNYAFQTRQLHRYLRGRNQNAWHVRGLGGQDLGVPGETQAGDGASAIPT